jgi:transcriptional regulator with XRE-family HTH domain
MLKLSVPFMRPAVSGAGAYLRDVRQRLGLGLREVQQVSSHIAAEEKNDEFYLSAARLAQIESGDSAPSMYKLFTLSAVYGIDFLTLLQQFGVNPDRTHYYRSLMKLDVTHPVSAELHALESKITLPVRLDPSFRWEATQLVSRLVALWGEIPAAFLQHLNPRRNMFGYIGLNDYTMYPLLRPGALVMVDSARRRIQRGGWEHEFERPIYFIELREGYRCSWCQSDGSRLTLISHPMSPVPAETFSLDNEAEVVGQVAGVAMRLVPAHRPVAAGVSRLPTPA